MTNEDELYRLYKMNRTGDANDTPENSTQAQNSAEDSPHDSHDEIDRLYQQYRSHRDPDFEQSIAVVMRAAKEKAALDATATSALAHANDKISQAAESIKNESRINSWIFRVSRAALARLEEVLDRFSIPKSAALAIPVLATVAVTVGIVGILKNNVENITYDLAAFNMDSEQNGKQPNAINALKLTGYVDYAPASALGFVGTTENARAFSAGAESVNMQIAALAGSDSLLLQSKNTLDSLLIESNLDQYKEKFKAISADSDTSYQQITHLLPELAESLGDSSVWFKLGRRTQVVNVASHLALDTEQTGPLAAALQQFDEQFKLIRSDQLSEQELAASRNILSYVSFSQFEPEDIRSIRDNTRNLKAMRSKSKQ